LGYPENFRKAFAALRFLGFLERFRKPFAAVGGYSGFTRKGAEENQSSQAQVIVENPQSAFILWVTFKWVTA
jgi:hypothetical protein